MASKYPSTITAARSFRIAARAVSSAYRVALLLKRTVPCELTYLPRWSARMARPPKAMIRPRPSFIGTMRRSRNQSKAPRSLEPVKLLEPGEDVTVTPAAKTVIGPPIGVDGERGRLLGVERAET